MAWQKWLSSITKSALSPDLQAIQTRILSSPYSRLQSAQEIQVAAALGIKIDVNRASVDDWLRLPGISIHQARSLVELTQSGVQFCGLEDLAAALGVPEHRIQPLQPVLQFCYYDPTSYLEMRRVNPNTASPEALMQVPGLGAVLATAIVQNRQRQGPFRNLADLQQRLSLSPDLTAQVMHYLQFSRS